MEATGTGTVELCKGAWIETASGVRFELLNPQPEMVRIEDIAHALANQCRFTGHCREFYSVAEHSWHVARESEPEDMLWGLLHDASEAYITDLSRPLKHLTPVGPPYLEIEARIMQAICAHFELTPGMPASVKRADNVLLFTEKEQLMTGLPWTDDAASNQLKERAKDIKLNCWVPAVARKRFMEMYTTLMVGRVVR